MKKIITICAVLLMTASVFAQAPEKMSYQAVVRDGSNALVTSTAVGMQISILQGSASGTAVYVETQTPTSNANGLVSLEIGSGIVVSGTFANIDWANGPYFIKTETDPAGGTDYTITGTSQLLSVPYALHAKTAESVSTTFSVGDFAQGGIVFWVDETGQHGLVAAKENQDGGSGIQWNNGSYTDTEANGDGVYAGEMNTMLIIANQGSNSNDYAAGVCANYQGGGYGDWYLPSKYELNLLYQQRTAVGGFASDYYWSSSENDYSFAWVQNFANGNQFYDGKGTTYYVRAIRAF